MSNKQQLNENPLVVALMGALVGMGLSREKAERAAQTAVAKSSGETYSDVMKQGSRGEGVRQLQQNLGMRQADGIFGPATANAVKTFQQSQGLTVDGVVGPDTKARIERLASDRTESVSEAISFDVEDLVRLMQLAGAPDAKAVDADDISSGPSSCGCGSEPCGCGDDHGPEMSIDEPKGQPEMGDMIRLMSTEDEDIDGDFADASTEPDEDYMNNVSASIPSGNDLHKEKGSYPATAGGDNPMNTNESDLEETIKQQLIKALAQRNS